MTAQQELNSFIDRYSPEVARLARAAFKWMVRKFPGATVLVYDNYNALGIGFGPSEKVSDAVLSLALYPRWVTLFFLKGAGLPDPDKRLTGKGKKVRHIVLRQLLVLEDPAVVRLIDTAAAQAGFSAQPNSRARIIIKSISANQRPRRPPSA